MMTREHEIFGGAELTDEEATRRAIDKIQKLMRLGAMNPNEAEAAQAVAKAQELLVAYNLTVSEIEKDSGGSGKRLQENVRGGMFKYQQMLWRNLAELNFCTYWTQRVRNRDGINHHGQRAKTSFEHRLVGRQVNVIATKNMASYLFGTIERLCRERAGTDATHVKSSWMVAYREGVADRVSEKVARRRRDILDEEEEKRVEAERRASRSGVSLSRELTIAGLKDQEEAGNYDFIHGAGAWDKRKEREAQWSRDWDKRREERARAQAAVEQALAAWAAANPKEAAAQAAKERAKERRREKRSGQGGRRWRFRQTKEEMRRDSDGYHAGYEAGRDVSIDPQVDRDRRRIGSN